MSNLIKYLIIAAAGNSSRMNNKTPKQYLIINGKPIIIWTLDIFKPYVEIRNMVIVISKNHEHYWNNIVKYYPEFSDCKIAYGGPERFHSIKSALKFIPNNTLVAVHDAARPMVSAKTIENCFYTAMNKGNAIPAINFSESVRQKSGITNMPIDRKSLKIVQTPQVFLANTLKDAYEQIFNEVFTDDASVVEKDGNNIFLTEGNSENIKITTSLDLKLASFILPSSFPSIDME